MYRTKRQAHKAALKVMALLDNKNWQPVITSNNSDPMGMGYIYHLVFHKGLLTMFPGSDGGFFCMFTFDDSSPGTGDPRFTERDSQYDKDPKALVDRMIQRVQDTVDKEVYELNVINELIANPKQRQPW